jgi:hypothetical protein
MSKCTWLWELLIKIWMKGQKSIMIKFSTYQTLSNT